MVAEGESQTEDAQTDVEARYLCGKSVSIPRCDTIGSVSVRVASLHNRLASSIVVVKPQTGEIMKPTDRSPPVVSVIIQPEATDEEDDMTTLKSNMRLHAEHEDDDTCKRVLDILENNGEEFDLEWVQDPGNQDLEKRIKTLLRAGMPASKALICMIREGRVEIVEMLLAAGADVNHEYGLKTSALMYAAKYGSIDMVQALLNAGARVNDTDKHGSTVLMYAAKYGCKDMLKLLLAHMESSSSSSTFVDHVDKSQRNALLYCAKYGSTGMVRVLLEAGSNVNNADKDGTTPLILACARHSAIDILELLLAEGAEVNHADKNGNTALIFAAGKYNKDAVRMLLEADAKVDLTDENGDTALMWATTLSAQYSTDVADMLVAAGADINHVNNAGLTAAAMRELVMSLGGGMLR